MRRNNLRRLCLLLLLLIFPWAVIRSELASPPVPQRKTYNVQDFGAVGDGTTVNTEAINKAIAVAPRPAAELFCCQPVVGCRARFF